MNEAVWQEVACCIIDGYDTEEIKEEYSVTNEQIEIVKKEITKEWKELKRVT